MSLSVHTLELAFAELISVVINRSEGFNNYLDRDTTHEAFAEECEEYTVACRELKAELVSRGVDLREYGGIGYIEAGHFLAKIKALT